MASPTSPFAASPAEPILRGDPALSDEQRADLFDAFHSKNSAELVQHLQTLAIPEDTKHKLFQAKQASTPPVAPLDKVTEAMTRLKQLDPEVLEASESHPNVLKALVGAATAPDKAASGDSGGGTAGGGSKTSSTAKKPSQPLVQPPRIDGLPHLPPIADGHKRLLASDGGLHDVPEENVEQARAIDPRLHVLNP
jgi:hypothetical protein